MFKCLSHEFSNIGVLSVALLAAARQQVGDLASSVDTSHVHTCAHCGTVTKLLNAVCIM